ncbi:hypothetical protein CWI38_0631p0020 [Hamiltosporidium tvaerminnensis]|uniref:Uncharacterized protein n=1 Tax=Hamiltosporidium tvaerminnensis TaxID=1176355 RepID=A0A4Q9LVY7_9MICR|nr:hypothetical protein CWI38_0631p0020 [Hamiltosporidium tvaerminnensis]
MSFSFNEFSNWLKLHILTVLAPKRSACISLTSFVPKSSFPLICTWSTCKKKVSGLKGTLLEKYKKSPEIFYKTIVVWLITHKFNQMNDKPKSNLIATNDYIGGNEIIVEIEESKLVVCIWVLRLVEGTSARKIMLIPISGRTKEILTA